MADMPTIYAPVQCGHCFGNLEFDEGWTCRPCGLHWPDVDPYAEVEPVFLDEDAAACGLGDRNEREHDGLRFWDTPCNLPDGHSEAMHHQPIAWEKADHDTES